MGCATCAVRKPSVAGVARVVSRGAPGLRCKVSCKCVRRQIAEAPGFFSCDRKVTTGRPSNVTVDSGQWRNVGCAANWASSRLLRVGKRTRGSRACKVTEIQRDAVRDRRQQTPEAVRDCFIRPTITGLRHRYEMSPVPQSQVESRAGRMAFEAGRSKPSFFPQWIRGGEKKK